MYMLKKIENFVVKQENKNDYKNTSHHGTFIFLPSAQCGQYSKITFYLCLSYGNESLEIKLNKIASHIHAHTYITYVLGTYI